MEYLAPLMEFIVAGKDWFEGWLQMGCQAIWVKIKMFRIRFYGQDKVKMI